MDLYELKEIQAGFDLLLEQVHALTEQDLTEIKVWRKMAAAHTYKHCQDVLAVYVLRAIPKAKEKGPKAPAEKK